MKKKNKDIFEFIERKFPLVYQEEYDNSGRQISFDDDVCTGILIAMDVSADVIHEAVDNNCNCIVTHHPLFFRPIKNISNSTITGRIITDCIKHSISIYAAHTNCDSVCWDILAKSMGLHNIQLAFPHPRYEGIGYGGFGNITRMPLKDFIAVISSKLHIDSVVFYGNSQKLVENVVALNGAGSRKIAQVLHALQVDCIVTGDVGYHDAIVAVHNDVAVIDIGHYASEKPLLDFLQKTLYNYLTKELQCNDIHVMISKKEINPMKCGIPYES